jgi:hypothetical protein
VTGDFGDCVVANVVQYEPVSPCIFRKCREIFTKCREAVSVTWLKAVRSQKLGWGSPYSRSREAILP